MFGLESSVLELPETVSRHHVTNDSFNNTCIDLSSLALSTKENAHIIKGLLSEWIETYNNVNKHVIVLKLAPTHSRIHKYALDKGFRPHHADQVKTVMAFCLHGHHGNECNYPAYRTISIGVTGVVFNKTLDKFIAIKEKFGPYKNWKAPTGGVDLGEEPVNAVVRELHEETGIQVRAEDAVFVGMGWTPNFRGTAPDINQVFAFSIDEIQCELKEQEEEIEYVKWLSVKDFKNLPIVLNHDKPFIIKMVVEVAKHAMQNQSGWHVNKFAWASGKEIQFYS